jgi:hypothetical protein
VVPVSRKRKKKSGKPARFERQNQRISGSEMSAPDRLELAKAFSGLTAYREHVDAQRAARAVAAATDLVADLLADMADQPDMVVEDALCLRLGPLVSEERQNPPDDRFGPHDLSKALVVAASNAVEAAIGQTDAWRAPWRALIGVANILPYPDSEAALDAIKRLRDTSGRRVLPPATAGPVVTGPVVWTRDRYGSRFAIIAPITMDGQPERWYLWDVDACGYRPFTVHCGFFGTAETALAAWQAGVGQIAAAGTVLTPVDDTWPAADLLPLGQGFLDSGGETVGPFTEYLRSKRLAEEVRQALPAQDTRSARGLDAATAAKEFATWLRARDDDQRQLPEALDELAAELADSWNLNGIAAIYATCSPHRVGLCVPHLRSFYLEEFAEQLVALLPEWTSWLAERNSTPPELAARCEPYAQGEPHPQVNEDDNVARVIE